MTHRAARQRHPALVNFRRLGGVLLLLAMGAPAAAQSGDGSTTGAVMVLPAGSRAAAMGGAYAAGRDIDVLFYNPAGAAALRTSAALSYERHVEDITFASIAASYAPGPVSLGLTVSYLDFGSIAVIEPDPAFGGQRGQATGERVDAGEGLARLLVGVPLMGGRGSVGAGLGVLYSTLAESGRGTFVLDGGVQYRIVPALQAGLAVRNLSSGLDGARLSAAQLPAELRLGLAHSGFDRMIGGVTARIHADVVANLETGRTAAAAGLELGASLVRAASGALRAGYDGTNGPHGLGRLHAGAGLTLDGVAIDYALQRMDGLGTVHRFGIRWSRGSR